MEHRLSAQDDGATVVVDVGDRVVVRLPENGGTGFLWALDAPPCLRQVDDAPEPAPLDAGIGGTGLHRFTFEVVTAPVDDAQLAGRLAQPWEPGSPAASWRVVLQPVG